MSKGLSATAVKNKASSKKKSSVAPAKNNPTTKQHSSAIAPPVQSVATCACGGGCPRCTSDGSQSRHEREARQLAPQLEAVPTPNKQPTIKLSKNPTLVNFPVTSNAHTGQIKNLQPLSRAPPAKARAPPAMTAKPDSRLGAGKPLNTRDKTQFEAALDMDLSHVRVYDGLSAAAVAQDYSALALTYGSHIVLSQQAQFASPSRQNAILAHELVHVAQQTRAFAANDPNFDHAPRAPPLEGQFSLVPQTQVPLSVQRLADEEGGLLDQAVDFLSGATDVVLEGAAEVIEFMAPGLMDFIRNGGLEEITDLFCTGIDTLIGGLFEAVENIDFMAAIETAFTSLTENVQGIQTKLGSAASSALGTLLEPLVESLKVWGGPLVEGVTAVSDTINSIFSGLWDHVAVPVLDFLEDVGGTVWQGFSGLVTWAWDLIEPIRRRARYAWDWLADQFDLAWDSSSGVREWLADKASDAWEAFLEVIEPIKTPLMMAGGILLLLSPLGPIIILTQVLPPLWEKITWLWNNWNTDDILVRAQEILREEILPGIINFAAQAADFIAAAASWLATMVVSFSQALRPLLEFFGASECLTAVQRIVNGIADQFQRLAEWAQGGFSGLVGAMRAIFNALVAIFQPILDFLLRLLIVAANPPMLPIAIAATIWLFIPVGLKSPVINFILDLMIAFISGFPAFLTGLGPLASVLKAGVLGFLRRLRSEETPDNTKITASNKMANMAAGGGIEFIAGFAWGLLRGLIDGILDPFRLLFLIFKILFAVARVIGNLLAPLMVQNVPGLALGLTQVQESLAIPQAGADTEAASPQGETAAETSAGAESESSAASPGAPVGARAPPRGQSALTTISQVSESTPVEGVPVGDAEITAAISPDTVASIVEGNAAVVSADTDLDTEMRSEVENEGATVGGLAQLLGDAWDWIISGAESLGARAAGAFMSFITQPDFQLGNQLGFVAGIILMELLIGYFTGGSYTTISATTPVWRQVLAYLIRFMDLGGEIFTLLGRALRPLRGPLMAGLEAAGGFLSRFRFARNLIESVQRVAQSVFRFSDEAVSVGGRGAGEVTETAATRGITGEVAQTAGARGASAEVAETAGTRTATGEVAETATTRAPARAAAESTEEAGERAAREAMETGGERASQDAVEEVGDGAFRAVDEPGVTRIQDDALRAVQFAEAELAARTVAETNDLANSLIPVVLAQLIALKRRYRWIDTFTARWVSMGHYVLDMIASPRHAIDRNYTTGEQLELPFETRSETDVPTRAQEPEGLESSASTRLADSAAEAERLRRAYSEVTLRQIEGIDVLSMTPQNIQSLLPDPKISGTNITVIRGILVDPDSGRSFAISAGFSRRTNTINGIPFTSGGVTREMAEDAQGVWTRLGQHVEGQTAAFMRANRITRAQVHINGTTPCLRGCNIELPNMLPEGSILTVFTNNGRSIPFRGLADIPGG